MVFGVVFQVKFNPVFLYEKICIFTTTIIPTSIFKGRNENGKFLILKQKIMSLSCQCPNPTTIGDIPSQTCPENFNQIQKFAIQRNGFTFDGTAGKDITLLADWQTLTSAVDDTHVVVTPFVHEAIITAGESITNGGGDNSTLNGESELVGVNPSQFTGMFKSLSKEVIQALFDLRCEKNLVVYFFNENGDIICQEKVASSYVGFPISSFFVGDTNNEGFATNDTHALSFNMKKDWSKYQTIETPADFDPLTDL